MTCELTAAKVVHGAGALAGADNADDMVRLAEPDLELAPWRGRGPDPRGGAGDQHERLASGHHGRRPSSVRSPSRLSSSAIPHSVIASIWLPFISQNSICQPLILGIRSAAALEGSHWADSCSRHSEVFSATFS